MIKSPKTPCPGAAPEAWVSEDIGGTYTELWQMGRIEHSLALDISTKTGFRFGTGRSGVLDLTAYRDDWGHMAHVFHGWLSDTIAGNAIRFLILERPFLAAKSDTSMITPHLTWTAHQVAFAHDVHRVEVRPDDWRLAVFGPYTPHRKKWPRADAKKRAIEWCEEHGMSVADDNEGDANCIMAWWIGSGAGVA